MIVPWPKVRIDSLGNVQAGRQRSASIVAGTPRPYLRVANVFDGFVDYRDVLQMPFTDAEFRIYSLKPGDILLNEGQSLELVGRSAIYEGPANTYCFQNTLVRFRPSEKVDTAYAQIAFQHMLFTGVFASIASRTTSIAHLGVERFASLHIPLPPIAEQRAIARVLSAWDRGIRQLSDLIAAKLRFKQGLMQQLLTGRRRFKEFKEQWSEHQLGDLFKEREETNRTNLPLLSITVDRGVVPRQEIERKDTSSENKSLYKRIAPGDIGYNTMRMWQGVSAMSSLEGIVSPAYTICIPRPAINAKFAAYLFKYPPVVHQFFRHSQGLVDDTLSLKFHHFAQIHVHVPSVEEQLRIVEVFQSADREIDLFRKKLDVLKTQKKGLMQKLLTGQVRVKVAPELKEQGPKP